MESARTKYQIRDVPVFEECVRGVRRSWVGASLPWESAGRCREAADVTVICLQGEAWVRLSALLVKAGAKLETDWGSDANGQLSVRMGAEAEKEKEMTVHIAAGFGVLAPLVHPATVSRAADQFANCK